MKRTIKEIIKEQIKESKRVKREEENSKDNETHCIRALGNLLTNNSAQESINVQNMLIDYSRELSCKVKNERVEAGLIANNQKNHIKESKWINTKSLLAACLREEQYHTLGVEGSIRRPNKYEIKPLLFDPARPYELNSELYAQYRSFIMNGCKTGIQYFDEQLQRYFMFVELSEQEIHNGSAEDILLDEDDNQEYKISMVGDSVWTSIEKKKFFLALERCSRGDVFEISRRVGPTKTALEVASYISLLDKVAKGIKCKVNLSDHYSAREMSDHFIWQEVHCARKLEHRLEIESFSKHQVLLFDKKDEIVEKSLNMFELWNMSSLTKLFAGINDMTILASSLAEYYQLLKKFIADIIIDIHTELLNTDKTVSRKIVNRIIAKRQQFLLTSLQQKPDRRLQDLDILSMLDGRHMFHGEYSIFKSASFLAKRRRKVWVQDTAESTETIEIISDSESEVEIDEQDDIMKPFDSEDDLEGHYDYKQHDIEEYSTFNEDENENDNGINDNMEEYNNQIEQDEEVEERMMILDEAYEQDLSEEFGFYTTREILDYHKQWRIDRNNYYKQRK